MSDDTTPSPPDVLVPEVEHVFTIDIEAGSPVDVGDTGDGRRLIIPFTGGTVSGRIEGTILPGGADVQLHRTHEPNDIVAWYAFETDDGDRVFIHNRGMRVAPPEVKRRLLAGEDVSPEEARFRTVPEFETTSSDLDWLEENVFVGVGSRFSSGARLAVFMVD